MLWTTDARFHAVDGTGRALPAPTDAAAWRSPLAATLPLGGQALAVTHGAGTLAERLRPVDYSPVDSDRLQAYCRSLAGVLRLFLPDDRALHLYCDGRGDGGDGGIALEVARTFQTPPLSRADTGSPGLVGGLVPGLDNPVQLRTLWLRHPYLVIRDALAAAAVPAPVPAELVAAAAVLCPTRPVVFALPAGEDETALQARLPAGPDARALLPWTLVMHPAQIERLWAPWPGPVPRTLAELSTGLAHHAEDHLPAW